MLASGTGLLPTTAQAVLGGWVFGLAKALPAAIVAYSGAALLGLLITRAVAGSHKGDFRKNRREVQMLRGR